MIVRFTLLFVCLQLAVFAGKFSMHKVMEKKDIRKNAVMDVEGYTLKHGGNNSVIVSRKNLVKLSYTRNDRSDVIDNHQWEYTVYYRVYDKNTPNVPVAQLTGSLTIRFDATTPVYRDIGTHNYSFQHPVVKIDSVSGKYSTNNWTSETAIANPSSSSILPDAIELELENVTERFVWFNANSEPRVDFNSTTFTLAWEYDLGAEEYDVEYVHIDAKDNPGSFASKSDPFAYKEPVRVRTTKNHYTLDQAFPAGTLYFRVRAIGRYIVDVYDNDFTRPKPGDWGYNKSIALPGLSHVINTSFEGEHNWQYQASFAEDGKRKSVVTYADGTGRQRQVQTNLNTEGVTLVAETKYDYEGRPAVEVLPAPKSGNDLEYAQGFNVDGNDNEFNFTDFDEGSHVALGDGSGAGQYYDGDNVFTSNLFRDFVPEGKGYVYTRNEFTRDGTGRINRQSGIGELFALNDTQGEGRSSDYIYANPTSSELHRMFGSNVGVASHYKKIISVDPNETVNISYLDQEGRTIATCMAGDEPDNLHGIGTGGAPFIFNFDSNNVYVPSERSWISVNKLYNSEVNNSVDLHYAIDGELLGLTVDTFPTVCMDCEYDLTIRITDPAGVPVTFTYNSQSVTEISEHIQNSGTNNCASSTYTPSTSSFDMAFTMSQLGAYTVTKQLELTTAGLDSSFQAALADAGLDEDYLDSLKGAYRDLVDTLPCVDSAGFVGYDTLINNDTSIALDMAMEDCQALLMTLESEMTPRWYADSSKYKLPVEGYYSSVDEFYEDLEDHHLGDDVMIYASYNAAGNGVGSAITSGSTVKDALNNGTFRTEWIAALANAHPGYCHYYYCSEFAGGQAYTYRMNTKVDWSVAGGYKDPLTSPELDPLPVLLGAIDNVLSTSFKTDFEDSYDEYHMVSHGVYDDLADYTGNQAILYTGIGYNDTTRWYLFRVLYQNLKIQARESVKSYFGCSADSLSVITEPPIIETQEDLDTLLSQTMLSDTAGCGEMCKQKVALWMWQLEDDSCELSAADADTVAARLLSYCSSQCGADNPLGVILSDSVQSPIGNADLDKIQDVFDTYSDCSFDSLKDDNDFYIYTCFETLNADSATYDCLEDFMDHWNSYIRPVAKNDTNSNRSQTWNTTYCDWDAAISLFETGIDTSCYTPIGDPSHIVTDDAGMYVISSCYDSCVATAQTAVTGFNGFYVVFDDLDSLSIVNPPVKNANGVYCHFIGYNLRTGYSFPLALDTSTGSCWDFTFDTTCVITGIKDSVSNPTNPCKDFLLDQAEWEAEEEYKKLVNDFADEFYGKALCMNPQESFYAEYDDNTYYYTLYYYDQAGNLVQTVPPAGYAGLTGSSFDNTGVWDGTEPTHTYKSEYQYNSLDLVEVQATPDAGQRLNYYNDKGQLRISQSAQQILDWEFSYSKYDELGRIIETGASALISNSEGMFCTGDTSDIEDDLVDNMNLPYLGWDITYTFYDGDVDNAFNEFKPGRQSSFYQVVGDKIFHEGQTNLRNRISHVFRTEGVPNSRYSCQGVATFRTDYETATHYSYDAHGNVKMLVQEFGPQVVMDESLFKRVNYTYDLISGNVKTVAIEQGENDQFMHKYHYDADNRLQTVQTTSDGFVWELDAEYFYYLHGPLARMEYGQDKVQGTDYGYTLQGWLKGLNSANLLARRDMGQDGDTAGLNQYIGRDAYAMQLGYYSQDVYTNTTYDDYNAIGDPYGTNSWYAPAHVSGIGLVHTRDKHHLYNGNIGHIALTLSDENEDALTPAVYGYEYDQLQRLRKMDYFKNYGLHGTNSLAMMTDSNIYGVEIDYDLNGNIDTLAREGHNPTLLQMDEMKYEYFGGTNQLRLITDHATSSPYGIDYVDSHAGQDYYYDADGNLTKDQEEQIDSIRWTTDGKVRKIVRSSGSTKDELEFKYGPMGNRFIKVVKPRSSGSLSGQTSWKYYYYLRDAQGNTLALYERVFAASDAQYSSYLKRKEVPIYGSSRIGQYTQSKDAETGTFMGEENGNGEIDSLNPHQDPVFNPTWGTTDDNLGYILPSDSGDYIEIKPRDNGNLILELWALNDFTLMGSDSLAFLDTNSTLDSTVDYKAYSPGGTLIRVGIIGADTNDYIRISGTGILNFMPVDSSDSISVTTDGSLGYIPSGPIWKEDGEFPWRPKDKTYELTNHLGNVMQTIDGQKLGYDNGSDSIADYYTADVLSYTDYYPGGMTMPNRNFSSSSYRYGFNGMEKDDEIKGSSGSYDFGARIYDPRVGRWLSRDPLEAKYPNLSPYNYVANNPIIFIDPDGRSHLIFHTEDSKFKNRGEWTYVPTYDKVLAGAVSAVIGGTPVPGVGYLKDVVNWYTGKYQGFKSYNIYDSDRSGLIDAGLNTIGAYDNLVKNLGIVGKGASGLSWAFAALDIYDISTIEIEVEVAVSKLVSFDRDFSDENDAKFYASLAEQGINKLVNDGVIDVEKREGRNNYDVKVNDEDAVIEFQNGLDEVYNKYKEAKTKSEDTDE